MRDNRFHQQEDIPDPLTEFLAQLLTDIPDVLPAPTGVPTLPSASTSAATPFLAPNPYLTCQWVSHNGLPLVCGASLSQDPKLVCDHFRRAHDIRGNEKVLVDCCWRDCHIAPMLRGSLLRHVLSVHLGLLRWRCEVCGKVFSRKGTGHACAEDG